MRNPLSAGLHSANHLFQPMIVSGKSILAHCSCIDLMPSDFVGTTTLPTHEYKAMVILISKSFPHHHTLLIYTLILLGSNPRSSLQPSNSSKYRQANQAYQPLLFITIAQYCGHTHVKQTQMGYFYNHKRSYDEKF